MNKQAITRRGWLRFLLACALIVAAGAASGAVYYHRFYYHITPQEITHAVEHRTFYLALKRGGPPLQMSLYQQADAVQQPLVLFTSGDGGWSPFCADIAAHIAAGGKTVVGFDAKTYLTTFANSQKPITPFEMTNDYGDILAASLSEPGVDAQSPVTLAGWSLGAGYSVLVAADPVLGARVSRVIAISMPKLNELAWKSTDALIYLTHGTPREKVFDVSNFLAKVSAPTRLMMLNATDDDTSSLAEARDLFNGAAGQKKLYIVTAHGHHFEGGEAEFYEDLDATFRETAEQS